MKADILTSAKNLRLQREEMATFKDSLVVQNFPKILLKSCSTFIASRLWKLEARAEFSNQTSLLTKCNVIRGGVTRKKRENLGEIPKWGSGVCEKTD